MLSTHYRGYILPSTLSKPKRKTFVKTSTLFIVAVVAFLAGTGQQDFFLWKALRIQAPHVFDILYLLSVLSITTIVVLLVKTAYNYHTKVYLGVVVKHERISAVYRIGGELYYEEGATRDELGHYSQD